MNRLIKKNHVEPLKFLSLHVRALNVHFMYIQERHFFSFLHTAHVLTTPKEGNSVMELVIPSNAIINEWIFNIHT